MFKKINGYKGKYWINEEGQVKSTVKKPHRILRQLGKHSPYVYLYYERGCHNTVYISDLMAIYFPETFDQYHQENIRKTAPSLDRIFKETCDYFWVKEKWIKGKSRVQHYVKARQVYMYIARQYFYSFSQIGEVCNRDHSTAVFAFNKLDGYMTPEEQKAVVEITAILDIPENNIYYEMFCNLGTALHLSKAFDWQREFKKL